MCEECKEDYGEKIETKVCKTCGEEKPVNEFMKRKNICKVCYWLDKHNNLIINNNWTIEEYKIILDNILNQRIEFINEIILLLNNKNIFDLLELLTTNVIIRGGNYNIKAKLQCEVCGNEFEIVPSRYKSGKYNYCSPKCRQESSRNRIKFSCEYCGKEKETSLSSYNKSKNHFCCNECADKYRSENARETRVCEICGKEYECLKTSTQRFCSIQCQGMWQSQELIGNNANGYNHNISKEEREVECGYCHKKFNVVPSKINNERHFCSELCRQKWYSEVWSQTKEWKEKSQIRAVNILEDGLIEKVNTSCQTKINNLLNKLNIKYTNEKGFKIYAVDNYLNDYNLIMEVMGTYWHTDNRFYSTIQYDMQVNRIKIDKAKHTYFKNNYNIDILYLWEYDAENNIELCKKLISEYIKNNGQLKNYNSFNYLLDENGNLKLNKELIKPYMEWDKLKLNNIIDLSVKEKMNRKQENKWTKFKCEVCGKDCEELTSHYKKAIHHCCSYECSSLQKKKRIMVECLNCGKDFEIKESDFKRHKTKDFFCSDKCSIDYHNITYNCENCNKEVTKLKVEYNKSKHHFCSYNCAIEFRHKNK